MAYLKFIYGVQKLTKNKGYSAIADAVMCSVEQVCYLMTMRALIYNAS